MIHVNRMTDPLLTGAFNRLGQYTSSPGHRAYWYAELAVSSLACTHCAYPRRDGQAEWTWVAWLNTEMVYLRTVTHPSTNRVYIHAEPDITRFKNILNTYFFRLTFDLLG